MKKKISGTKFFADPNLSGWFNLVMLYQPKQKSYASTGIFQIKSFIFPRPLQARGITKSNTMSNATGRAAVGQPAVNRRSAIGQPPPFFFLMKCEGWNFLFHSLGTGTTLFPLTLII